MTLKEFLSSYFYNDMASLPVYGLVLLVAFGILMTSIWLHELGHWVFFKYAMKKNVKIRFVWERLSKFYWEAGEPKDYEGMTDKQHSNMMLSGVMMGLLPILVSAYFWPSFILLVIPYAVGSWPDIKEMSKGQLEEDVKEE